MKASNPIIAVIKNTNTPQTMFAYGRLDSS
jgi:hypothetical protein